MKKEEHEYNIKFYLKREIYLYLPDRNGFLMEAWHSFIELDPTGVAEEMMKKLAFDHILEKKFLGFNINIKCKDHYQVHKTATAFIKLLKTISYISNYDLEEADGSRIIYEIEEKKI